MDATGQGHGLTRHPPERVMARLARWADVMERCLAFGQPERRYRAAGGAAGVRAGRS
jgi:hypothetical protein